MDGASFHKFVPLFARQRTVQHYLNCYELNVDCHLILCHDLDDARNVAFLVGYPNQLGQLAFHAVFIFPLCTQLCFPIGLVCLR